MSTVPLPDEPSLDQLRRQARELQRAVRAGDPAAIAEVRERHPGDPGAGAAFRLTAAQLVVARRHGFASWARLAAHVEVVRRYSRFPDRLAAAPERGDADRFLLLACLDYETTGEARWAEAAELLAARPGIVAADPWAAAAAADAGALRRHLAADPAAAIREGGPYRWTPLLYLAYARHDPGVAREAVLAAARVLLDAGADPNDGFLWHGLPTPFTVLTGVLGEGERGPQLQPPHPHDQALGRLLLERGADPNDGQGLYNRMFRPGTDHLELLLAFGLGTGPGGPWHRRLGPALDSPADLVAGQLRWALQHGMADRVALLADHGFDVTAPLPDGTEPAALAATSGHPDLAEALVGRGAPRPVLGPQRALVAAVLAGDRAEVDRLCAADPDLAARLRRARPGLVPWAAATAGAGAVALLVELGYDIDAPGRSDLPRDEPWHTALHAAVETGRADLVRDLLRLGADPNRRDARFDATPLGWARHLDHPELVAILEPVTVPPD